MIPLVYLAAISVLAVVLTVHDKHAAVKGTWRVKERTLLAVAVIGGSAAMLASMLAVRHKTRRKKFMVGLPLIIAAQVLFVAVAFNQSIEVSHISVTTDKLDGTIKLALITDFHSCDYGTGQIDLISKIDAEKTDVLLLSGDIFDDVLPPDNTIELIADIAGKYPCNYVTGSHEFWSGKADEFKDILRSYGVSVLEGTWENCEIRGAKIVIGGVDDPDGGDYSAQLEALKTATKVDSFTILLSNRPERIDELLPLSPDLVVAGHAHGGQWRIPYILENGLFAPNQGFFPKYTNGAYSFGGTMLIVSRGLARESTRIPRVFNRPELVIITLTGAVE